MQTITIDKRKVVLGGALLGMFILGTGIGLGVGMHSGREFRNGGRMIEMRGSSRFMPRYSRDENTMPPQAQDASSTPTAPAIVQ